MSTDPTAVSIDALRRAAAAIAASAGYRLVVLFGSMARGEPAPGDIDVGIEAASPVDVVDATTRFMRELHVNAIDVVDLRRANPVLLMTVARDGVPVFEATGTEMSQFVSLAMRRYADTKKFRDAVREDLREFVARRSSSGGGS